MNGPMNKRLRQSFKGATYDCRLRAWYFNTATDNVAQWTSMYIDKTTNQPAFAVRSTADKRTCLKASN